MQGKELLEHLEKFPFIKKYFDGLYSADTLPKKKSLKYRHFIIVNTAELSQSEGHWYCFLCNDKSLKNVEVFDSLGITSEKRNFLITNCHFRNVQYLEINEDQFQSNETQTCGQFVLYYIIKRMENLCLTYEEFFHFFFSLNVTENENAITKFFRSINHL